MGEGYQSSIWTNNSEQRVLFMPLYFFFALTQQPCEFESLAVNFNSNVDITKNLKITANQTFDEYLQNQTFTKNKAQRSEYGTKIQLKNGVTKNDSKERCQHKRVLNSHPVCFCKQEIRERHSHKISDQPLYFTAVL